MCCLFAVAIPSSTVTFTTTIVVFDKLISIFLTVFLTIIIVANKKQQCSMKVLSSYGCEQDISEDLYRDFTLRVL